MHDKPWWVFQLTLVAGVLMTILVSLHLMGDLDGLSNTPTKVNLFILLAIFLAWMLFCKTDDPAIELSSDDEID